MEIISIELRIQSMDIRGRHLDHIKENHLSQEEGKEKLKYFQQTHLNGNLELIILSCLMTCIGFGEFIFKNFKFLIIYKL